MKQDLIDERKKEIIDACKKLYQTTNFNDVTIKSISDEVSFSRASIYNYFQTKEEIFLAFLKREYGKWIDDLNYIYEENESLSKDEFADKLTKSIEKREKLLKLISMNMYEIEDNSRLEELVEFKKVYSKAEQTVRKCIDKFFKNMSKDDKDKFIYTFFPFMYGIYPYTEATKKQKDAIKKAKVDIKYLSIYEITYNGILKLLN